MDSQTNRKSMNRVLVTVGEGSFREDTFELPEITSTEICVRNVMTGVCRSDIDMMNGEFGPLPLHMQGHEGLGQVIKVGSDVSDVRVGDYVATRGEPAYADYYNVRAEEYVYVPEADPKYIIEPVACGINCVSDTITELQGRALAEDNPKLLIIGSGFLAYVAYQTLQHYQIGFEIATFDEINIGDGVIMGMDVLFVNTRNKSLEVGYDINKKVIWGGYVNV